MNSTNLRQWHVSLVAVTVRAAPSWPVVPLPLRVPLVFASVGSWAALWQARSERLHS